MVFPGIFFATLLLLGTSFLRLQLSSGGTSPFQTRKVLVVEYHYNCGHKFYPFYFNYTFTRNGTYVVIKGEEIISRDIKNPISVHFRIDRCKDKSNPDTCEYYNTWKWDNLCPMTEVLPFARGFANAHTPPLLCPFKKNQYHLKEARIESNDLIRFLAAGESNSMWKFRVKLLEKDVTVACVDFALRIANLRKRN